jgi:hypothetical protein
MFISDWTVFVYNQPLPTKLSTVSVAEVSSMKSSQNTMTVIQVSDCNLPSQAPNYW